MLAARGPRRREVAAREVGRELLEPGAEAAEPDDDEPRVGHAGEHERPRGEQQLDALGGDQLADEDDEAVALGVEACQRVGGRRRVAGERGRPPCLRGPSARARRAPPRPARAAAGSRGPNCSMSTPGGPSRVRRSSSGSSIAAHRLSAVWREPTSTPRARARPSRAYGRKRGCGLTVYSSAEPWIFDGVGDVEPRQPAREHDRAHHEVVGERDVRPRALGDLADRGDVALQVGVELGVGELGERPGLDAVVAVGDVDGQQAADVGAVDRRARGLRARRRPTARRRPSRRRRRPTPARTARAPGTAGAPRGPRARAPRRAARCRRSSPCRPADSRGRSGCARGGP